MTDLEFNKRCKGGLKEEEIKQDQERVLDQYFNGCGRVAVSAGAGTGKTTLLAEIISEAVIRLLAEDADQNPFDDILAITFTVEAAREMKKRVKDNLKEHFEKVESESDLLEKCLRWIESESWISTIDSLTRNLLSEVALDAKICPSVDVPEGFEDNELKEEIFEELERDTDEELTNCLEFLKRNFPEQEWQNERGWKGLLERSLEEARTRSLSANDFGRRAEETFRETLYRGYIPDFERDELREILGNLRDDWELPPEDRVRRSYEHNLKILKSFQKVLKRYEELYDEKTKKNGLLSHNDTRYWTNMYVQNNLSNSDYSEEWRDALSERYEHILVDEFQDTSYSQCNLLKAIIGERSNVFLIGDPKQTIFEWREASPEIFTRILNNTPQFDEENSSDEVPYLGADGFRKISLKSNFRSHDSLIDDLINPLFGEDSPIFDDDLKTGGLEIPHSDLEPEADMGKNSVNQPHIHTYENSDEEVVPEALNWIRSSEEIKIRKEIEAEDGEGKSWEPANLGDCCILMQTRSKWPKLRRKLVEKNIDYVMLAEKGLFNRPEISIVIDVLDWFANPHHKDSLIRILRSPAVGLSEKSMRYLGAKNFELEEAIKDPEAPEGFRENALPLLKDLIDLRDDLRWEREKRKVEIIEKILKYSHLDTVLLTHRDGDQCLANVWFLLDIISSWEEEELLTYDELIERLRFYQESGSEAYNQAVLADEENENSVRISTVHGVKGLEFPIVFVYKSGRGLQGSWFYHHGDEKIIVREKGEDRTDPGSVEIALKQVPPDGKNLYEWEKYFTIPMSLKTGCGVDSDNEKDEDRLENPRFFDPLHRSKYAENWRLFYVALTRAKDHIVISSKGTNDLGDWRQSWRACFYNDWYRENKSKDSVADLEEEMNEGEFETSGDDEESTFDRDSYERLKERYSTFTPRVINPSHLYDILFCPRRYQYVELQKVNGGDICAVRPSDKSQRKNQKIMGDKVHRALELRDFSSEETNHEFENYVHNLNQDYSEDIESAVDEFLNSDFFDENDLSNKTIENEMEIMYEISEKPGQNIALMKDKIDLVIFEGNGKAKIVDYKTFYPEGDGPHDKYTREHYRYQLRAYALALEKGIGIDVTEAFVLAYNGGEWKKQEVLGPSEIASEDLEEELRKKIKNIEIHENKLESALEKGEFAEFCDKFCKGGNTDIDSSQQCEFIEICQIH